MRKAFFSIGAGALGVILLPLGLWLALPFLWPLPAGLLEPAGQTSTWVLDREGRLLHEVLSPSGERMRWVELGAVSPALIRAVLAQEDKRFFRHPGADPLALARAAWQDLRARRIVSGGSTVTMQVARDLLGDPHRTAGNKLRETLLAVRLERQFTKEEILTRYLNRIPFGGQVRGVERAAQGFFGKPAAGLTLAEAALLAVVPRSPVSLNPARHSGRAKERADALLRRMEKTRQASPEEVAAALAEEPGLLPVDRPFRAPHLVQYLRGRGWDGAAAVLRTTLDPGLQKEAEAALRQEISRLALHGVENGALVVLDNATGEVLAFVGSRDFADADTGGQNNGCLAPRQPGSALKPFTYALALSGGMTLADVIPDVEAHFPSLEGSYSPRNFNNRFYGPMRAREALANSLNVSAVKVAQRVGTQALLNFLRDVGFTTLTEDASHYGLGLTLGNAEVTLLELASAYACLARGGLTLEPRFVAEGKDARGAPVDLPPLPDPRRVLTPQASYLLADVLSDENARMAAFGVLTPLNFPWKAAVKTGTSRDFTDNWTVGFTPRVTVGVWVGNFDARPMRGISGITGAAPVFHRVMMAAMERAGELPQEDPPAPAWFDPPPGLVRKKVCALSGKRPTPACRGTIDELFLAGTQPRQACGFHRLVALDSRNGLLADETVPREYQRMESFAVLPAPYAEWARSEGVPRPPADWSPLCKGAKEPVARRLALLYPDGAMRYILDGEIPRPYQTILPRLDADEPLAKVEWYLDGAFLGTGSSFDPPRIPLSPGRHTVRVKDPRTGARSARVAFEVVRPEALGYFW